MAVSIIAGSTGLIGRNVLKVLCNKQESIIALTRRPISDLPTNANQLIIDFASFDLAMMHPSLFDNTTIGLSSRLGENILSQDA